MPESTDNISQIMPTLQQLQLENEILRDSLRELQASTSMNPHPIEPNHPPSLASPTPNSYILEPKVSLPDKFDGSRSRLRGFVNQIRLII